LSTKANGGQTFNRKAHRYITLFYQYCSGSITDIIFVATSCIDESIEPPLGRLFKLFTLKAAIPCSYIHEVLILRLLPPRHNTSAVFALPMILIAVITRSQYSNLYYIEV
jgi:hypothetical protein